ncbi:MAG: DUF5698 domain-containing protein [Candidatus Cloacimonetes bacterium]|nr:DUF5698 domain-containing protein [Candidatus Cloacimonadota bacterium]MDD4155741.1 DUF5698 domain-containing protein [Candidatus Cloacimonadota bacterium]
MTESIYFQFIIFPLLIILARIADVSMGTLRIILLSKGHKRLAPIIGFFEVFIWILVAKQIITDVSNIIAYLAYALGYALGTYVGMAIESKLSLGKVLIRSIINKESEKLIQVLRENHIGLTTINAQGKYGDVKILFIIVNRTELNKVISLINSNNPKAFYTIESIQSVNAGYFSTIPNNEPIVRFTQLFRPGRKGK